MKKKILSICTFMLLIALVLPITGTTSMVNKEASGTSATIKTNSAPIRGINVDWWPMFHCDIPFSDHSLSTLLNMRENPWRIKTQNDYDLRASTAIIDKLAYPPIGRNGSRGLGPIELVSSGFRGCDMPCMVLDSMGTVHVVWYSNSTASGSPSNTNIYYKMKPRGGNWSAAELVSTDNSNQSSEPSLAVNQFGDVIVVWTEYYAPSGAHFNVYYNIKPSGGNWSSAQILFLEISCDCWTPSVITDANGTFHVMWSANTSYGGGNAAWNIYSRSKPRNGSWSPVELVYSDSGRISLYPRMALEQDGTIHVVWMAVKLPNYNRVDIFYEKKSPGGTWSRAEFISRMKPFFTQSIVPSLAVGPDGTVHVSWTDFALSLGPGNVIGPIILGSNIYYREKPKDGQWSPIEQLTFSSFPYNSMLAVGPDNTVHLVYDGHPLWYLGGLGYLIFYMSKPSGGKWSHPEIISVGSEIWAYFPRIVVGPDGKTLHIVWCDMTNYYGSNPHQYPTIVYRTKHIIENHRPTKPVFTGPRLLKCGRGYPMTMRATDPDGDQIYYYFNAFDLLHLFHIGIAYTYLIGPYPSGTQLNDTIETIYYPAVLMFRVVAIDDNGAIGDWTTWFAVATHS
jgi:hypothetical protein